ncbi:MAG: CHC2 zinc finger domain-containing protein [Verrucomicrobiota bacterium]
MSGKEAVNAELPTGWLAASFSDVAKARMGPTILAKDLSEAGLPVYSAGKANTAWGFTKRDVPVFPNGTIIVSARGSIGFPKIPKETSFTSTQTTIAITPSPAIGSTYLQRFLQSSDWAEMSSGAAIPMLTISMLGELAVPLAPLPEQKRIADKLEAVLGRVDACRARLDRVPALLKRFRQSVLAAATSGQLTESWRESFSEAKKSNANSSRFLNERYSIPEEWEVKTLSELSTMVTSGSRGWADYYSSTGAVFIRAQNINADRLDLKEVAHVQLPDRAEGKRAVVKRNDLLITITGANVGKSARVKIDLEEAYISQHIALVKLRDPIVAAFIELFLWAENAGRGQLNEAAYGGGKPGLNLQNIRDLVIGLPSLPEQQEIVRRVEALFAFADRIEARLATAQKTVERLTPATLAKAFRGELVPQDPNDEPAHVLLKRMRVAQIPKESVEKVLEATDIVDLIGSYIQVKRAGSSFRANCPFHQEKTPSFYITPSTQRFHCFGCGKGGDAISFVRDHENLPFEDAVRKLASRAGIHIIEEDSDPHADQSRRARVETPIGTSQPTTRKNKKASSSKSSVTLVIIDNFTESHRTRVEKRNADFSGIFGSRNLLTVEKTDIHKNSNNSMSKSRFDSDVKGQKYLANFLKLATPPEDATELFKVAQLPIVDFYKQLAWEVEQGFIKTNGEELEAAS